MPRVRGIDGCTAPMSIALGSFMRLWTGTRGRGNPCWRWSRFCSRMQSTAWFRRDRVYYLRIAWRRRSERFSRAAVGRLAARRRRLASDWIRFVADVDQRPVGDFRRRRGARTCRGRDADRSSVWSEARRQSALTRRGWRVRRAARPSAGLAAARREAAQRLHEITEAVRSDIGGPFPLISSSVAWTSLTIPQVRGVR